MACRTALILIVDDELSMLSLLDEVLGDEGFVVRRAQNGQEALARALAEPPDLIITDLMMPVMDGRVLAQHLHDHPATTAVPILVMSAAYRPQSSDCFTAVLPKPFAVDTLLAVITRLLV